MGGGGPEDEGYGDPAGVREGRVSGLLIRDTREVRLQILSLGVCLSFIRRIDLALSLVLSDLNTCYDCVGRSTSPIQT